MTPKPWLGSHAPTHCQICGDPLVGSFVDGATKMGPWAYMCLPCFKETGYGLGVGRGQQYSLPQAINPLVGGAR